MEQSDPLSSRSSDEHRADRSDLGSAISDDRQCGELSMDQIYGPLTARRSQSDSLMWQTPALTLAAQAFLLTISLGADSSHFARTVTPRAVGCGERCHSPDLFAASPRRANRLLLAEIESVAATLRIHGKPWTALRDQTDPGIGVWRPLASRNSFAVWAGATALFALANLAIIAVTWLPPEWLA